jgi:malonyl-CoA O-methyltransferase
MLMRAKSKEKDFLGLNKLLGKNNISYICGDMEHLPIKKNLIDLVWTSSSLQWCNDLNKTFLGIKEILNYGGLFIFSTFGPKTLTELSAINKKLSQNDTVNSFTDMHQIGDMLVANGFSDPVLDSDEYTLTYSNVEKLFVDIKSIGATSSNTLQKKGLRGRNYFKRMAAEYDKYKKSGLLPATYEVIYGHAWNMNKNQNFKTFEIKHE